MIEILEVIAMFVGLWLSAGLFGLFTMLLMNREETKYPLIFGLGLAITFISFLSILVSIPPIKGMDKNTEIIVLMISLAFYYLFLALAARNKKSINKFIEIAWNWAKKKKIPAFFRISFRISFSIALFSLVYYLLGTPLFHLNFWLLLFLWAILWIIKAQSRIENACFFVKRNFSTICATMGVSIILLLFLGTILLSFK